MCDKRMYDVCYEGNPLTGEMTVDSQSWGSIVKIKKVDTEGEVWRDYYADLYLTNAREEIETILKNGDKTLTSAIIHNIVFYDNEYMEKSNDDIFDDIKCAEISAILRPGYTAEELEAFLDTIDVWYDSGYGLQNLYGTLWFTDGSYATREEYDGSEWWDIHEAPSFDEYYENMVEYSPEIPKFGNLWVNCTRDKVEE